MYLASTEAFEVHAAELAHDVLRRLILVPVHAAFNPRRHGGHFVQLQLVVVFTVDVALLAVEMFGVIQLVIFHLLLSIEAFLAVRIGALDRLQLADIIVLTHLDSWVQCC